MNHDVADRIGLAHVHDTYMQIDPAIIYDDVCKSASWPLFYIGCLCVIDYSFSYLQLQFLLGSKCIEWKQGKNT